MVRASGFPRVQELHRKDGPSDGHAVPEEIVVFVVATLSRAQVVKAIHEFDGFDPLNHLESQLVLAPQPQRGPVEDGQGLPIHLVREQRELMSHVVNAMHVVVAPAFTALGKGVENDVRPEKPGSTPGTVDYL